MCLGLLAHLLIPKGAASSTEFSPLFLGDTPQIEHPPTPTHIHRRREGYTSGKRRQRPHQASFLDVYSYLHACLREQWELRSESLCALWEPSLSASAPHLSLGINTPTLSNKDEPSVSHPAGGEMSCSIGLGVGHWNGSQCTASLEETHPGLPKVSSDMGSGFTFHKVRSRTSFLDFSASKDNS